MGKMYSPGDIVMFKHLRIYKNNGSKEIDTRLRGHPYIILNDIDELGEEALCLLCSSSKKGKRKRIHYFIKNLKLSGFPKKSTYANIKNVYRVQIKNFVEIKGRLSNETLLELKKLVKI